MDDWDPALAAGDTIIISASRTLPMKFSEILGTSGSWITITNPSDAKVIITGSVSSTNFGTSFFECRYIHLVGNNYGSETYGLVWTGSISNSLNFKNVFDSKV